MSDLISRQWLLDLYETPKDGDDVDWKIPLNVVRQNIKDAPSTEAAHGEWIIRTDNDPICRPWYNTCKCSKCGQYGTKVWNYCPNCGAKMNGGEEDD